MSDFHVSEDRKAAKHHVCDECGRTIDRGEQYTHHRGFYDGYPYKTDICAHCKVAWWYANAEADAWEFIGVGDLVGEWREWAAGDVQALRLAAGIKRRWRTSRGRLLPVPALTASAR